MVTSVFIIVQQTSKYSLCLWALFVLNLFILGSIIADRVQIFYFGPQVFQASSFCKSDDSRKARQC